MLTAMDPPSRQIVLCEGAAGMGKPTVVREVAQRLQERGWYTAAVRMSADTQSAAALGRSGPGYYIRPTKAASAWVRGPGELVLCPRA